MVRNYSIKLIKALLTAINNNKVEQITTYKEYDFLEPSIQCSDLSLQFRKIDDRYDIILNLLTQVKGSYIKLWKAETAAGKFLMKDYRKQKRDFLGNTLYSTIIYNDENTKYQALIRVLDELNDEALSDMDKEVLITSFADITINDKVYSIIKILPYKGGKIEWSRKDIFSRLKCEDPDPEYLPYDSYIKTEEDNTVSSSSQKNSSPLF